MPAGLQCWDENGKLAVDLSDFTLRYISSGTIYLRFGNTQATLSMPGISPSTHVVFVTASPSYGVPAHVTVVEGGIRAYIWTQYGVIDEVFGFDLYRYA